jgi:hypothetical protein
MLVRPERRTLLGNKGTPSLVCSRFPLSVCLRFLACYRFCGVGDSLMVCPNAFLKPRAAQSCLRGNAYGATASFVPCDAKASFAVRDNAKAQGIYSSFAFLKRLLLYLFENQGVFRLSSFLTR